MDKRKKFQNMIKVLKNTSNQPGYHQNQSLYSKYATLQLRFEPLGKHNVMM